MKSRAIIPLLLGGVVGLAAIKFGVDALQRAQGTPTEMVKTVVARVDIPASYEITPEMLGLIETPASPLIPEGAFTSVEALGGRVTSKGIPQGAVIGPLSLAPPGTPPGLTERIPEGFRAVSVKIDEVSGVAGQITPGDYVDVIVVLSVNRGRRAETISRIILQRIKVLAVGRSLGPAGEAATGQNVGPQQMARSITLLVADVDVPKLHLAQRKGEVTLAMRGADDRMLADNNGRASTIDWEQDPAEAPSPDADGPPEAAPTTIAEQVAMNLGPEQPADTPGPPDQPYTVTVVNGPIRAEGTSTVQRVTYENRYSMRVTDVSLGRTGEGYAGSPDSTEGIMRRTRPAHTVDVLDPAAVRDANWTGGSTEPQDREIAVE